MRLNQDIRAREVRLVGEGGEAMGVVAIEQALAEADKLSLDLVEIAPNANPPVAKLMDYGKFKYEQGKKEQEQRLKNKPKEVKTVRFSIKIGANDFNIKSAHARRFLSEGHKVKLSLLFRGREITHRELGLAMLERAKAGLLDIGVAEDQGAQGREIFIILAPNA